MTDIAARWAELEERVARACAVVGRSAGEVAILAAVKTRPPEQVVEVLAAGARVLGHNRAQELAAVEPRVRELWPGATRRTSSVPSRPTR